MCKRLCCVDIMLSSSHFFFVLICTLLPKKNLYMIDITDNIKFLTDFRAKT